MLLLALMPVSLLSAAPAADEPAAPVKTVDYKRADLDFYSRADVLKADPEAAIVPPTALAQNGDTYTLTPRKKAPKTLYLDASTDWIEPITPPDMPASLEIAPDAMQIREPQGDVQVAMPSAPANFAPVTDGMSLPNGAVIKTGTNATAAILFGGVDSARLMPDSEAAVQQTVTPTSRVVEVDLTAGGVFSKVGTQEGVRGEYRVHSPFGIAVAAGGDFATVAISGRTDVWISLGTVDYFQPDGRKFGVLTADGTGPLRLLRFPAVADPSKSLAADAESLTAIMNFLPVANQKLAALHAKQARGTPLSANEEAYLGRIKQVPALIKLARVEPPPPPPPAPAPAPAPVAPPVAAVPPPPEPVTVILHPNGTIKFKNATTGLAEFKTKLGALIAAKPDQPIIIKASPLVPYAKFAELLDACKASNAREIAVAPPSPQPPANPLAPAPPPAPVAPAALAGPDVTVVPPSQPEAAPPVYPVMVHQDGTIDFRGKTTDFAGFNARLKQTVKATPAADLEINAVHGVSYDKIKAVLDACADAQVHHVTAPEPPQVTAETPPAPAPPTAETPPAPAPAPAPVPVNDKPIPAEMTMAPDGSMTLNGSPVTQAELPAKFDDIAATHPKNPVVLMKQRKVTKAQWQPIVDLAHAARLKLLVKDAKDAVPSPPPPPRPSAAEGSPSTAAAPAPSPAAAADEAVAVEIELTPDGQVSFLGEPVTDVELQQRLHGVAATNVKDPVLIVKDEKVTHDQLQHIVDACHAARLKVRVKTVKSSDSGALEPHAPGAPGLVASAEAGAPKLLPVEIGMNESGSLTFEGTRVTHEELKVRLASIALVNPKQPVVILKKGEIPRDSVNSIVVLCHQANLKATVKAAKAFVPLPPEAAATSTPVRDPNAPAFHLTPTVDAPPSPEPSSMPNP
jgi:biopolymer transport protein ExbD